MLYDRDYMRGSEGAWWRSPVFQLLVVLGALFFVECFLRVFQGWSLGEYFGLSWQAVRRHEYWRLFTYQFLHSAPWPLHFLFNALGLWFFGRPVLETVGRGRFWLVYLGSGFIGGLFELAAQAWHPHYGVSWTVGASASVLGLAGAYCLLFPTQESVFFFYVIPVRLRSMTMFWVLLGFNLFGTVFPHGGIAYAAHVGGILAGAAYAQLLHQDEARSWFKRLAESRARRRDEVAVPAVKAAGKAPRTTQQPEPESSEDFIRREVDPILDKITAHGIQSLTERERRILEKARERMRNR
ncbi:MAG: rhomboid family intramembrane serine protease [Verrucomicrobiales bacterium]|nr:rhomboid family intramembrane serine protease [Verrucomicrobiales bacterium]